MLGLFRLVVLFILMGAPDEDILLTVWLEVPEEIETEAECDFDPIHFSMPRSNAALVSFG